MNTRQYLGFIFLLASFSIFANPMDSTLVKKYSENESYWGIKLGRFHNGGEYFTQDGVSLTFLNEYQISKYFYLCGNLQVYKTIESDEGAVSLNGYLNYPLKIAEQNFFIKAGAGLATLAYLTPILYFEIEYIVFEFEKTAITVSVEQSFPKLPLVVNVGLLF